ncbi:MAG: zf-HC2 domain-containing protein [Acidobacteria bacterium]|nr:zf-HC2 domain-containing protein [Acidobacteriota bacterium]
MECRVVINSLSDYLDGSLAAQEFQSIEAHLTQCPPCNAVRVDLTQITLAAKELPLRTPSRALWIRIQNEIEIETAVPGKVEEKKVSWWKRVSERNFTFTLPQLAGASMLAFSLMVFGMYHALHRDPQVASQASSDTANPILPMEKDLQFKIQQKASQLNTRRVSWNPEIRTVYDNHLQRIDNSLSHVRQSWVTTRDTDQQKLLMDLYNEKLRLMEDFERLGK